MHLHILLPLIQDSSITQNYLEASPLHNIQQLIKIPAFMPLPTIPRLATFLSSISPTDIVSKFFVSPARGKAIQFIEERTAARRTSLNQSIRNEATETEIKNNLSKAQKEDLDQAMQEQDSQVSRIFLECLRIEMEHEWMAAKEELSIEGKGG
jgi:hypothetical protein